jgi:hypothetical protein
MAVKKKKGNSKVSPVVSSKPSRSVAQQEIAARAYQLWEASGRRHGEDRAHWFQAERELRSP